MATPGIHGARNRLLVQALAVAASDLDDTHTEEAEHGDEQLALAARDLVRAIDKAPADAQPVGWTKGARGATNPLRTLTAAVAPILGGIGALYITQTMPLTIPGDEPAPEYWEVSLPCIGYFELDGHLTRTLPDDDPDYDKDSLAGEGATAEDAAADLLRMLKRLTLGVVMLPPHLAHLPNPRVRWHSKDHRLVAESKPAKEAAR